MRHDDWQNRLAELIDNKRNEPFDFATHNCLMWAFDAIKAVNDQDLSKPYRGKYKTEKQAAALLRKIDNVKTSQELLLLKLKQDIQPIAFARIGDIVLFEPGDDDFEMPTDTKLFGPIPGVCSGVLSYFVGFDNLLEIETLRLSGAIWVS